MKSPLVDTARIKHAKPASIRGTPAILAALLWAVPVAAAAASPSQTVTAAAVPCDPLDPHPRHIAQVKAKEAPLSYSVEVRGEIMESGEVWRGSHGFAFAQVITSIGVQRSSPIYYNIRWQRRDQTGHPVGSGAYKARLVF